MTNKIKDTLQALHRMWHPLIVVEMDYPSVGARRRAELLRALMLTFAVFSVIGAYATHGAVQQGLMMSLVVQIAAYTLSRTPQLALASMLGVIAGSLPQYYPAFTELNLTAVRLNDLIQWMLVPLILSSLWLRPALFALFTLAHLGLIGMAPYYFDGIEWQQIAKSFGITEISCALLWMSTLVRNRELKILDEEARTLREGKSMLSAIQDNIQELIVVTDQCGYVISANNSFQRIFDLDESHLSSISLSALLKDSKDKSVMPAGLITDTTGKAFYGIKSDGQTFPVEFKFTATEIHGRPCYVGVIRDVRQQKRYEEVLKQEKEIAEQANRAKTEFLSNMSHELRTPLNAILGFAQLLEFDKENFTSQNLDSIMEIRRGGEHLLELINEVLDMAKIEAGMLSVHMDRIHLQSVFDECYTLTKILAQSRQISLEFDNAENYTVDADPLRLKQVLLNYLSNAVKYNRTKGNIRLTCEVRDTGRLRISVTDSGFGIKEEEMVRLFKPFERMEDNYSGIEGVGIGLAISKKLMELMGGDVGASSEEGIGSQFWIEMNYQLVSEMDYTNDNKLQTNKKTPDNQSTSGKSILS